MLFRNYTQLFCRSILASALLICCQQKQSDTHPESDLSDPFEPVIVDLSHAKQNNSALLLSAFAESIQYIPLTDEPLIYDIRFSSVRVTDDYFFVDGENIFKYDKKGNFIQTLFPIGEGPKEAKKHSSTPAAFNYEEEYCTFPKANGNTYISYSFKGDYLGEESVRDSLEKQIRAYFLNNQIFSYRRTGQFKKDEKVNILGPYLFYAKNIPTDSVIYRYPNPAVDEKATYRGFSMELGDEMFFINMDSLFWFKHRAIDTLYVTRDLKQIYPKYIFKLNSSFMDIQFYLHLRVGDIDKTEFEKKKRLGGIMPLSNGRLLYTINEQIGMLDQIGKVSGYTDKPVINDLDNFLKKIDLAPFIDQNTFAIHQGYLYILMDAYHFFEEGSRPPFTGLTEESNPVIVKIKLKQYIKV